MAPLDEVIRIYEPADTLRQIRVTTVTTDTLTLPRRKDAFSGGWPMYSPPGRKVRRPWW